MQLEEDNIPPIQIMRPGYHSIVGVFNLCLIVATTDKLVYPISLKHPLIIINMLINSQEVYNKIYYKQISRAIEWTNRLPAEQQNVIGRILIRRGLLIEALDITELDRTLRVKVLIELNKPKELFDLFEKEQNINCYRDNSNTINEFNSIPVTPLYKKVLILFGTNGKKDYLLKIHKYFEDNRRYEDCEFTALLLSKTNPDIFLQTLKLTNRFAEATAFAKATNNKQGKDLVDEWNKWLIEYSQLTPSLQNLEIKSTGVSGGGGASASSAAAAGGSTTTIRKRGAKGTAAEAKAETTGKKGLKGKKDEKKEEKKEEGGVKARPVMRKRGAKKN